MLHKMPRRAGRIYACVLTFRLSAEDLQSPVFSRAIHAPHRGRDLGAPSRRACGAYSQDYTSLRRPPPHVHRDVRRQDAERRSASCPADSYRMRVRPCRGDSDRVRVRSCRGYREAVGVQSRPGGAETVSVTAIC